MAEQFDRIARALIDPESAPEDERLAPAASGADRWRAGGDIDVRDPFYLRHDARHAVETAKRQGVIPFCLTRDPAADAYAQHIFGARYVQALERVERLPQLYARLTG